MKLAALTLSFVFAISAVAQIQAPPYTPKFRGDPAHSNAEAVALGYMRTVAVAEQLYKKKHGAYAGSLHELIGHGSFTRRMTAPEQGDYTVKFRGATKDWSLALVPKTFDADHRAFFMDESGTIRAEADKPATASSEPVKKSG
ncbi:MAG: hypothetical protein ACRD3E_00300 [Terriglobales bacterium]